MYDKYLGLHDALLFETTVVHVHGEYFAPQVTVVLGRRTPPPDGRRSAGMLVPIRSTTGQRSSKHVRPSGHLLNQDLQHHLLDHKQQNERVSEECERVRVGEIEIV